MTAPTLVAEVESAFNSSTSPKTSPTITGTAGDVIVVFGSTSDNVSTLNTPTNTGTAQTWTLRQSFVSSSYCTVYVWTCVLSVTQNFTVSVTRSGGSEFYGINVHQYSGSDGVGTSGVGNATSGGPSVTTGSLSADSAVVVGTSDWNAADGTTRTWRSVNGTAAVESLYFRDSARYTVYVGRAPAGAAGTETVGLSAPTGQKWALVYVEVLGSTGGPTDYPVTGTIAATSATSGAPTLRAVAAGTIAAVVALTGTVALAAPVTGTIAVTSSTSGAPTLRAPVAGTVAVVSASSGAPTLTPTGAAGTVTVTSSTSGAPTLRAPVTGTAAATSAASGAPTLRAPVAGTVAVVSATSGSPTLTPTGAAGTVTVTSSTSGAPTLRAAAAGTITATSSTSGAPTLRAPVTGTIAVVSTTSGAPTLPGGEVDTRVLAVVEHARPVTIVEHPRPVTITTRHRTVAIRQDSA